VILVQSTGRTDYDQTLELFVLDALSHRSDATYRDLLDDLTATLARVTERLRIQGKVELIGEMPARYRLTEPTHMNTLAYRIEVIGRPIGRTKGNIQEADRYLKVLRERFAKVAERWRRPLLAEYSVEIVPIYSANMRGLVPAAKGLKAIVLEAGEGVFWTDQSMVRQVTVSPSRRLNLLHERLEVTVRILG